MFDPTSVESITISLVAALVSGLALGVIVVALGLLGGRPPDGG